MPLIDTTKRDRIRELNDAFRKTLGLHHGHAVLTAGVNALPQCVVMSAIAETMAFNDFTEENDPNGEHDFGSFELEGQRFFWKIDYYDSSLEFGSEDPADPDKTTRGSDFINPDPLLRLSRPR